MNIQRKITPFIGDRLFKDHRIIAIYGPRRSGKTTLAKYFYEKYKDIYRSRYYNCDDIDVLQGLSSQSAARLKAFLGDAKLVILDEAQRVENIGINLKLIHDTYPEIQIIATGSSSFDLANMIKESLVGRIWEFFLPPITVEELGAVYSQQDLQGLLKNFLIYGFYPQVLTSSETDHKKVLSEIVQNYLYKDVLLYEGQKNSLLILKLLKLLAFQIGSEISINELCSKLEVSKTTVTKYLDLFNQTFITFHLPALSRNLRDEVTSKTKIFFWDIGVRNALIENFNEPEIRPDIGGLWENFCIAERLKFLKTNWLSLNQYFWRTYNQKEIDYVEEFGGRYNGYEMKWKEERFKKPAEFLESYPNSRIELVNKYNAFDFISNKEGLK